MFDFQGLLRQLSEHHVRYVLIGGVAMSLQGSAHVTTDLDIAYDRTDENLARLAAALSPLHPTLRGAPADLPFIFDARTLKNGMNFTFSTDLGDLDILGIAAGITAFEGLWERADEYDVLEFVVRVASLDDLIAMKVAANRPKDQKHVMELESLKHLHVSPGDQ